MIYIKKLKLFKEVPYRTFLDLPAKLAGVPLFYSIYFNLKPLNVKTFVNLFISSPDKYKEDGIKGVGKVLKDFENLEHYCANNWATLNNNEKVSFGFILLHTIFASWRLNGIYEFIIDCPPAGFNIESFISKSQLRKLELIKKECTNAYKGVDQKIYAFLESIMKEIRRIASNNDQIVMKKYRKELENTLLFTNFYEMMQGSILQLLYKYPGIYRFSRPVVTHFKKHIKHFYVTPTTYYMFPKRISYAKGLLKGLGASSGKVKGKVKVCFDVWEATKKIKNKEILVCHKTDPSWTPVFSKISGILTESGGMLSHAAIVAREYQIPCIVAVEGVLESLKDDMFIEIDGETGVVNLL